jgi:hypothetical protein
MEAEEEKLLDFLTSHVPPWTKEKAAQCMAEVDELRLKTLMEERTIALLPLLSAPSYPQGIIPDKGVIIKHILSPSILNTKEVTPAFVQHASLFVNFIHSKPDLFAKVVCKRYGQQDFHFMVFSVVPAIYGFFSSYEHVTVATPFYQHVIHIAPPNIASDIIQPFFCSLGTFRFLESVIGPFCQKFGGEIRLDDAKRQKELIPQYANELMHLISKNLCLLPHIMLLMFNTMVNKGWSLRSLIDMFFGHYFTHQSIAWIASSPFSHKVTVFQKILKAAIENVKMTRDVLRGFVTAKPLYEIPSAYKAFDEDCIQISISIADIMCAARCYETEDELPYSLRNINYEAFPVDRRFSPFILRVFTKQKMGISTSKSHLIFPIYKHEEIQDNPAFERIYRRIANDRKDVTVYQAVMDDFKSPKPIYVSGLVHSKEFIDFCRSKSLATVIKFSNTFENYLIYKVNQNELHEWRKIATKRQLALMTPMALKAAKTAACYYQFNIGKAFARASNCFLSVELKKLQFYTIIVPTINATIEQNIEIINKLEDQWGKLMKENLAVFDPIGVNSLPRQSQYIFWECVEEFRSIAMIVHSRQFDLLISVIRKLYIIASTEESIAKAAVIFSENAKLPSLYILSHEYIVSSPSFIPLIDEPSRKLWEKFGVMLQHILKGTDAGATCDLLKSKITGASALMNHSSDSDSSSAWFYGAQPSDFYKLSNSE